MRIIRPLSLLAVAMAASVSSVATAFDTETAIELRSARIEIPTISSSLVTSRLAEFAGGGEKRHAVIRLHAELGAAQRAVLADDGIELQTCLGARTWIAAIAPKVAQRAGTFTDRIAWAGELPIEAKIHPYLAAGNVPEWTIHRQDLDAFFEERNFDAAQVLEQLDAESDPVIAVYVLAHRDVDLVHFAGTLPQELTVEVRSKLITVNGLLVRIPMGEVTALAGLEDVLWVEPALPPLMVNNESNRANTQVEEVWAAPYGLSGDGVSVIVYDGGFADSSHADFGGRVTVRDSSGQSTHATHVCGTVGGDGSNSGGQHAGMAPGVTIQSYGFEMEGGLSEGFLYTDPGDLEADYGDAIVNWGAVVANNSIGTNTASNGFPCEWTGDYGVTSSLIDSVVLGALGGEIRIVWSAGNERQTDRCGDLYHTTAPPACAKNHITVGALNSNDDSMTYFSSWGPADDGRLKPDVTGPGCQSDDDSGVTSTFPGGGYGTYCGTSMSGPTVTGVSALVIEQWRLLYPESGDIPNSALKALLANTGDDLGNIGPDCQYGFGTVRARQAIDSLRDDGIILGELGDGEMAEHLVLVSSEDDKLRITVAWDDVPASPLPVAALVNDLDLVVTSPSGERVYPWTIDPDDPGAPATQGGEDRLNNIEQVTVDVPMPGAWRVQVVGYSVPVGPQAYSLTATPSPLACSSTGVAGFGGAAFQPKSEVSVTVVDCDLNLDDEEIDTVEVLVYSDDEPAGETITLVEEDPVASVFSGTIQLSNTDGKGVLMALDGSDIVLEYIDAMDTDGNVDVLVTDSARVDGTVAPPTDVEVTEFSSDSATVHIVSEEPVRVRIIYGFSCDALYEEVSGNTYATDQDVVIRGLEDTYSYAFRVELTDQAGNVVLAGDGEDCFEFTVPDALDYYAEQFASGIDLEGMSTEFAPIASADFYIPCTQEISSLPVDPSGGTTISLSDDAFEEVSIPFDFPFYGQEWNTLYVGSNGYVTFGGGSTTYSESFAEHFNLTRIAPVFNDFNPNSGGTVSTKDTGSAFAITWENVPEFNTSNSNTFQVVLHPSGEIVLAWTELDGGEGIVGLSPGGGQDPGFIPSDLSEATIGCVPRPPTANSVMLSTNPGTPVDITLLASDDGDPGPFVHVIETLPAFVLRDAATGEQITDVPYEIPSGEGPHLVFEPAGTWEGVASFLYHADDGGTPPEGGPSNTAEVRITVTVGPSTVYSFPMDEDPGWSLEGEWAFGQPTGGGGQYGYPDPTSGATGPYVLGYDLNGDYDNYLPEYSATTGSFDCSELTGVSLRFMRWLNVEQPTWDHAELQVSIAGGSFQTFWENTAEVTDNAWVQQEYDLSDLADGQADVRIRWTMGPTDSAWQFSGWNIDDVEIRAIVPPDQSPADLNGDGVVNGADLTIMLSMWGPCRGCLADLDGNGFVDGADLTILLGAWGTSGSMAAHDDGDPERGGTDLVDGVSRSLLPLVNDDRLAPWEFGGLLLAPNGYVQLESGLLELELAGSLPIEEHDLVVVSGDAVLGGELVVRMSELELAGAGTYVVLLADRIIDAFHDVRVLGARDDEAVLVCLTERALVVRRGALGSNRWSGTPAFPSEAFALIDAIGTSGTAWDLDGDGAVSLEDLGILLREGVDCE